MSQDTNQMNATEPTEQDVHDALKTLGLSADHLHLVLDGLSTVDPVKESAGYDSGDDADIDPKASIQGYERLRAEAIKAIGSALDVA